MHFFIFQYYLSLVDEHYKRLGFKDEGNHVDRSNRLNILWLACRSGHSECRKEAGERFQAWIKDKSAYIPPNLRTLTYRYESDMPVADNVIYLYLLLNLYSTN